MCSKLIQDDEAVFLVYCAQDSTAWALYGGTDTVKCCVAQIIAEDFLKNHGQGNLGTSESVSNQLKAIFENPEEVFKSFFYK